ncbi:hypothetical protein LC653_03355 [Nostoc sp. CHAB 5784]|uniref:hypothetical protein n=1 Tax=Nostoc mirabile TaxID=2907820 RepID=UPI001E62500D|nr:hypothetical protein [Nostoc mirabile]MCC5662996.1 hypothetical protein [Nostoc mirabile CHAB5784]
MKQQLCFSTVAAVMCLYSTSALGQSTVTLDQITPQEIVPKSVELIQGDALTTPLPTPSFNTQVKRQLQVQIPINSSNCPSPVTVSYVWMPGDNNSGKLITGSSEMNVKILSHIANCTPAINPGDPAVVEVVAQLQLDFPNIKASGIYSGKLLVTVVE